MSMPRQMNLFSVSGDSNQMRLFPDPGCPDDLVACPFAWIWVGKIAESIDCGWCGKIISIDKDQNGDWMAKMIGINQWCLALGQSIEESLDDDDIRWFSPDDLILLSKESK